LSKRSHNPLLKLLSPHLLREYAGEPSHERGVRYFEEDRVVILRIEDDHIQAKVRGTHTYMVEIWDEGDAELGFSCTCPFSQDDGAFCKHCVAVGLAVVAQAGGGENSGGQKTEPSKGRKMPDSELTLKEVEEFLGTQEKSKLVSLLVRQAEEDSDLMTRLSLLAGKAGKAVHLPTYRKAIDRAINRGHYIDYHSMYDYVRGIENVIRSLRELLEENHAAEVVELSEHFLRCLEAQMEMMDDSDGYMRNVIGELESLHHQACVKARPDPEQLAKKLFAWGLKSHWEVFYHAVEDYADVLGEKGLRTFRALAEERWRKLRPLNPGEDDLLYSGDRFRITSIMEQLAGQSGDLDVLVAVKSKNLGSAYAYLEIAEICTKAKNSEKALEWAEKGLAAFPEKTDSRLREFLAREYHKRGRHKDAMDLSWKEFVDRPGFEQYRLLNSHAKLAGGAKAWTEWRERALQLLRDQHSADQRSTKKRYQWIPSDSSTLVKIFLWEKDVDQAWLEAQEGGCHESLWLDLAAAREADHPEDALAVYKSFVEPAVNRMNNQSYQEAAEFVKKVQKLLRRTGRGEESERYLESLRTNHRRKRNFMKLLE